MLKNPYRARAVDIVPSSIPFPSVDADTPRALLARCPSYQETPLVTMQVDGSAIEYFIKDERPRMGLGSFKALGAAYVIAHAAQNGDVRATTFVTASAGNHGLSVAAGAKIFGAKAVVYLSNTVPEGFAARLRDLGAQVVRAGEDYEASMRAAQAAAAEHGWFLLSDSSWVGYTEAPHRLMEGYLVLAAECVTQMTAAPTHIFLQAGVGGLATACAAYFRKSWGDDPQIIVVEPDAAPALYQSIEAGQSVVTSGPVSNMGRLDCKEPSLIALKGLARDADGFVVITDQAATDGVMRLADLGIETTESGGAGLIAAMSGVVPLTAKDRVLCIISEEA